MNKKSKLIKVSLICALIFGCVGVICGCKKNNVTVEKTEQEEIYNLYVQYMNAKGEKPLTYDQWLASIKGEKGDKGLKVILVLVVMRKLVGNFLLIKYKPQQHCRQVLVKVIV